MTSPPVPVRVVYIGDEVRPQCLRRAQAFVDLLVRPPPPARSADRQRSVDEAGRVKTPPHPFRVVLDALAAARRLRREEAKAALRRGGGAARGRQAEGPDGTDEEEAHEEAERRDDEGARAAHALFLSANGLPGEGQDGEGPVQPADWVRADLQQQLGVYVGSAMYREWVLRPREHLQGTVRDVARAALRRLRDSGVLSAAQHTREPKDNRVATTDKDSDADDDDDDLDVHVQLLPSPVLPLSPAAAGQQHSPFVAVVTVRRSRPLAVLAEEQRAMAARLLSAAAPGQTVSSALRFWEAVSYGDVGVGQVSEMGLSATAAARKGLQEAGVVHCAALGLSSLLLAHTSITGSAPPPQQLKEEEEEEREGEGDKLETSGHTEPQSPAAASHTRRRGGTGKQDAPLPPAVVVVPGSWASVEQQCMDAFRRRSRPAQQQQHQSWAAAATTIGLGINQHLSEEVKKFYFDARDGGGGGAWLQPDALLLASAADVSHPRREAGATGKKRAREAATSLSSPLSSPFLHAAAGDGAAVVKTAGCGIVAVLYITVEGMAYVAYPHGAPPRPRSPRARTTTARAAGRADAGDGPAAVQPEKAVAAHVPPTPSLAFPLEAKDSFTRGLLGL